MADTLTTKWSVDSLLRRAEKSREEAERWFRFVQRFDESRRNGRHLAAARRELATFPAKKRAIED